MSQLDSPNGQELICYVGDLIDCLLIGWWELNSWWYFPRRAAEAITNSSFHIYKFKFILQFRMSIWTLRKRKQNFKTWPVYNNWSIRFDRIFFFQMTWLLQPMCDRQYGNYNHVYITHGQSNFLNKFFLRRPVNYITLETKNNKKKVIPFGHIVHTKLIPKASRSMLWVFLHQWLRIVRRRWWISKLISW